MLIPVYDKKRNPDYMKWNILAVCGDLGMANSSRQNESFFVCQWLQKSSPWFAVLQMFF